MHVSVGFKRKLLNASSRVDLLKFSSIPQCKILKKAELSLPKKPVWYVVIPPSLSLSHTHAHTQVFERTFIVITPATHPILSKTTSLDLKTNSYPPDQPKWKHFASERHTLVLTVSHKNIRKMQLYIIYFKNPKIVLTTHESNVLIM